MQLRDTTYDLGGDMFNVVFLALALFTAIFFNNCGAINNSAVSFHGESSVEQRFGDISCVTFSTNSDSQNQDCHKQTHGWLGSLYYLQDRTDGETRPATLFNRFEEEVPFDRTTLSSVNVLIETGFEADHKILMPDLSVPSTQFSDGFKISEGQYLTDKDGKVLIEAFALDLKTRLQLADREPGYYTFAVLSDDGSIVDMDLNSDGELEEAINNDAYHSPRLMCYSSFVEMTAQSKINMRLRYFQGPRTTIALTFVMKKVDPANFEQDDLCGQTDSAEFRWFGEATSSADYQPDYVNSPFGQLLSRGWFIPNQDMFLLPTSL